MELRLVRSRIFAWHLGAIFFFMIAHCVVLYRAIHGDADSLGLNVIFNVNEESNLPAFFSALVLATCALTAFLCARIEEETRNARTWMVIAGLLLFMAVDEAAQIHETFADYEFFVEAKGAFAGPWVAVYLPIVAAVAALLLPFWWRQAPLVRMCLALGAAIYVGAAIGMEMIEALIVDRLGGDVFDFSWVGILSGVEECGEMLGVAVLLQALLARLSLSTLVPSLRVA